MKSTAVKAAHGEWRELSGDAVYETSFALEKAGFAEIRVLAKADSDWSKEGCESAALRIHVDGRYNQDLILFGGSDPLVYPRLLGYYEPGTYRVQFQFQRDISSPGVDKAYIQSVEVQTIASDSELYRIYRHAPILYGRNLHHPYESRYTDTPMVLFYWLEEGEGETAIEYHMMFSHEDGGTPGAMLMSKWGRTSDIEWVYRVVLDADGKVKSAIYQGPHHKTTEFAGRTDLGGHPVLQVATVNGNVSDQVTSQYRFLLPPVYRWDPAREPRERVMDAFPFTYRVTAQEMLRQHPRELPPVANSFQLTDLRHYLYVQCCKLPDDPEKQTCVDIQVKLRSTGHWYSSSFGDLRYGNFRAAYTGPYPHFATTVKLPPGTTLEDIEEICAVLLEGGADAVLVPELKAFFLTDDYTPGEAVVAKGECRLTREEPKRRLWPDMNPRAGAEM